MGAPRLNVLRRLAASLAVLAAVLIGLAGPAAAAAYRYWGYYQLTDGAWAFATKGPDQVTPKDGSVEGWRFAVAGESDTRFPRATLFFAQICGSTPAQDGKKRVGVVIDYGRDADAESGTPPAPRAACAVVDTAASGAETLAAVATARAEKGLICGLDSWPATGCGDEVTSVSAAAKAVDTPIVIAAPATTPTAPETSAAAGTDPAATSDDMATKVISWVAVLGVAGLLFALLLSQRRRRQSVGS